MPSPFSRFLPWIVAAGLALVAAWLGIRNYSLRADNDSLRTQHELAVVAQRMTQSQLAERTLVAEQMIAELGRRLQNSSDLSRLQITALVPQVRNMPEARAIAVWDPGQQTGLLTVEKLPAVAQEQDYQIWIIDPHHPHPIGAGVFKPDSTGRATLLFKGAKPAATAAALAISLERAGGAPEAGGPIVLLGRH